MTHSSLRAALGLLATLAAIAPAQLPPRPTPIPLWTGSAPGAHGNDAVDIPTISLYPAPAGRATGAAIIVCPGGSYRMLADHEGHAIAVWLNTIGITAIVLKYRLGPQYGHPAPLKDAARALRTVRAMAREWGIDPARVGIMGFSAGGHLASTLATHFDAGNPAASDPIDRLSSRPDVAILAYPVISMQDSITHAGSRRNLLGPSPSADLVQLLSNESQVTGLTPPTFLFHTADDPVVRVENSIRFAEALRRAGVPYELHVFASGPHGVGLAQDIPALAMWPTLLDRWLRGRGFVK